MYDIEEAQDHDARERLVLLEARVAELEVALSRVLGMQGLGPSAEHFAKTLKLSALAWHEQSAPALPRTDSLGLTAAFATLDSRVAEASDQESSLLKKPGLSDEVLIDPSLIDEALMPLPATRTLRAPSNRVVRSSIEELHPSLLKRISTIWQSGECHEFLRKLIIDDRGDRNGFDPHVMSELLFLTQILEDDDGEVEGEGDVWAANPRPI